MSSSPSSELVPLTYARRAYNVLYDTELMHHTDMLTHEQACRIRTTYDIEVHVGTHGRGESELLTHDRYSSLKLPTQQEYNEVANVVGGMRPGDVLFVEMYGHDKHPDESAMLIQLLEAVAPSLLAAHRRRLERTRKEYKINAWEYAVHLAILHGIQVVYADCDAFDDEHLQAMHQGRRARDMLDNPTEEELLLLEGLDGQRERRARNVLKDWALEHLPPEGEMLSEGRKIKLALLFGEHHAEGLEQAFRDINLEAKINVMWSASYWGRAREQAMRVAGKAWGSAILRLLNTMVVETNPGKATSRSDLVNKRAKGRRALKS